MTFASHRIIGGSSRGSGKARVDVVQVDRREVEQLVEEVCKCGGAKAVGRPHAPIYRRTREGREALVDCDGSEWHLVRRKAGELAEWAPGAAP